MPQEFAKDLFVLLAGSSGVCEPGDDALHSKAPGAASIQEQQLPKADHEVCRPFMLQLSFLFTEGCNVSVGSFFLKGKGFSISDYQTLCFSVLVPTFWFQYSI